MKHRWKLGLGVVAIASCMSAVAADYPDRTVNYIIPFGPGGESDISARLQEPVFEKLTGQRLAIQYKPGAGGAVVWSQMNRMTPDGYTIIGTNLPHIVLQPLEKDVGYKTDDVNTLYWFHVTPDALLVPADSPYKTLKDFIEAAKKSPGSITVSGSGTNSANHLAKQRFDKMADIKTTYIPFSGTGKSNLALLGKQVNGSWGYTSVQMQLGDQVHCLAVAMEKRHPKLPDCPTFKESGFDLVGGAYRGVAVPKSTPAPIQARLAQILRDINHDPEFIKKMENNGFSMLDIGPKEMPDFMAEIKDRYGKLAEEMGITKK
ncbi:Bug family tripartite tricarboxylate transporter substrate binding protein [Allopusillimonas ginsengisoli]|uniref:Bug family tripartite tricarboxylate transporter substrate binding protein n=1 Tax=Allopusillimonas ginsengisoli TaxID=453575 RepID=UPI0010C19EF3|nr:tripartite tricarboxylate transporter substrate binding protein [Allopusillimonas ginsengisoli]